MSQEAGTAVVHGRTDVTEADYRAYSAYAQWHEARWLSASMMLTIVCLAGVFTGAVEDAPVATVLAGLGLMSLGVYAWLVRRARGALYIGPALYTADAQWFTVEMPGSKSTVAWGRLVRVTETDDHFFLNLYSLQAFVVPKRAFMSAAEVDLFRWLAADRLARN